ncbi:GvpL/GvpF family gas vesicle protein [Streptomyces coeruleorubidus]|uniref:GvpL/GvpF family gas vesicle protein n=1 Tax=Streptomyces coeruleorubidus TaxID=116188 RepID=UPI0033F66771
MTQTGGTQPAATSSGSGTGGLFDILELILDRLGEPVARQVDARQWGQAEEIVGRLSGLAASGVVADPSKDDVLNVSFLVEHARADEFTTAGRRLAHDHGDAQDFRPRGPLPPYSFAA